jgi:cyclophilin family peptidyl-prolyl cis-trans isomerase
VLLVLTAVTASTACAPFNRTASRARAVRDSSYMPLDFAAPDSFLVAFETTKGRFDVLARTHWAPLGAERFYELVHRRFYDSVYFHRVVKGFVAQFGMNGNPDVGRAWGGRRMVEDPLRQSNKRGTISFARGGPNTRTTQVFINLVDNVRLDTAGTIGYSPFAEVVNGMAVVDSLNSEYGSAPNSVPDSARRTGVNEFFRRTFPKLDMIKTARVIQEWRRPR